MSQLQIQKALRHLIAFKRARIARGFWNENIDGLHAIDQTLKAFGIEVE